MDSDTEHFYPKTFVQESEPKFQLLGHMPD